MHADQIQQTLGARLHAASPIQGRHIRSVAVKVTSEDPQTAWVTITDQISNGEPIDHLFSFSWTDDLILDSFTSSVIRVYLYSITGDEHVARELAPHLGMNDANTAVAEEQL